MEYSSLFNTLLFSAQVSKAVFVFRKKKTIMHTEVGTCVEILPMNHSSTHESVAS